MAIFWFPWLPYLLSLVDVKSAVIQFNACSFFYERMCVRALVPRVYLLITLSVSFARFSYILAVRLIWVDPFLRIVFHAHSHIQIGLHPHKHNNWHCLKQHRWWPSLPAKFDLIVFLLSAHLHKKEKTSDSSCISYLVVATTFRSIIMLIKVVSFRTGQENVYITY